MANQIGVEQPDTRLNKAIAKLLLQKPYAPFYVLALFAQCGAAVHHLGARARDWAEPKLPLARGFAALRLLPLAYMRMHEAIKFLEEVEMELMTEQKPTEIPLALQDVMNELDEKLAIAGEGVDLFEALKKVHRHIHENPENLMFIREDQIAQIIRASEMVQGEVIKTSKAKAPSKKKTSNDLLLADDDLDLGSSSGEFSLGAFLAKKKS